MQALIAWECKDMCMDMRMDMYIDMRTDMCGDMCVSVRIHRCRGVQALIALACC